MFILIRREKPKYTVPTTINNFLKLGIIIADIVDNIECKHWLEQFSKLDFKFLKRRERKG